MEDVTLAEAKERLEELIERAARGEVVRIVDPKAGKVRLLPERVPDVAAPRVTDTTAPRVTDTMEPFVPLKSPRVPGRLAGKIPPPPDGFFDPLTDEELKHWYGDDA